MAFVTPLPVASASSFRCSPAVSAHVVVRSVSTAVPRMGYGDYSLLNDRTKGHVQQFVIRFRNASDIARGRTPDDESAAMLGRDVCGRVKVPAEGVPQPIDPILLPDEWDEKFPEDPRIAEAKGEVYRWDSRYKDPQFAPSTYADVNDEEVSRQALLDYVSSSKAERYKALTSFDPDYENRIEAALTSPDLPPPSRKKAAQ